MKYKFAVIIPSYNSADCLVELYKRLKKVLHTLAENSYQIIFVDDGSKDVSWQMLADLAKTDQHVKAIKLSRNFGQLRATTAGIDHANAEYYVIMDCDLQDQPEEIIKFYQKIQDGYDMVLGRRYERQDNFFKKMSSKVFYAIFNYLTDLNYDHTISNFGIYSDKVIKAFRQLRKQIGDFPTYTKWIGFKIIAIDIEHADRFSGKTTYSLWKLLKLSLDLIINYSNKPLHLSVSIGLLISAVSFLFGLYIFTKSLFFGSSVTGWASLIVSIYFIGGLLLANIGIVGLYVGKISNEIQNQPLYLIDTIENDDAQ